MSIIPALLALTAALAQPVHDSWISRVAHRSLTGEFCCGEGDCFVLEGARLTRNSDGAFVLWSAPAGGAARPFVVEVIPEAEAQPSPDGSRRCFFAPPPST